MFNNKNLLRITLCLMIALTITLAGCSPKATATIDPNTIYTQAAETVTAERENTRIADEAQIDVNAIKTEAVQTMIADMTQNAPEPTATETQQPVRPTATIQESSETQNSTSDETTNNNTQATPKPKVEDVGQFLYQYPGDDFQFNPGSKFDAVFRFKNVGPTTWNSSYTLRWYLNSKFGLEQLKYTFADAANQQQVKPGETVEITIKGMQAPTNPGTYQSNWRLCNDKVQCFYLVYIQIVVD